MERLRAPFRGLRWKLTLSYTAVTVGSLLVVVLGLSALLFWHALEPDDVLEPDYWLQALNEGKFIDLARDFLAQSPPDILGVKLLINNVDAALSSYDVLRIGDLQLKLQAVAQVEAAVVDASGALLGVTPGEMARSAVSERPFRASGYPELDTLLPTALSGEQEGALLWTRQSAEGTLLVAVPVLEERSASPEVLGAIAIALKSAPARRNLPSYQARAAAASLVVFLAAAGLVGAGFGSATARGLVKRFQRLSRAADAWSQADFREAVDDTSGDELGQLAQRMNLMAKQLRSLLVRRQEMAVMQERSRRAQDLHDSVKQQAFAASAQLAALSQWLDKDPELARRHLREGEALVDAVRRELNDLILQLRPAALEDGGLRSALRSYAFEFADRNGIEVQVRVAGEPPVLAEVEDCLFRIAQEALWNVARHSQAESAEISLDCSSGAAVLSIADDGLGFDPGMPTGGLGLRSMRERAQSVGGDLAVESAPGKGTKLTVRCPLSGTAQP